MHFNEAVSKFSSDFSANRNCVEADSNVRCKTRGLQGAVGWTSFQARKASSKIELQERLRGMDTEMGRIDI